MSVNNLQSKQVDILELLKDGRHFAEKRGDRVHIIDSLTGNSIVMYVDTRTGGIPTQFVETGLPNGATAWIQEGINPLALGRREIVYSPVIIDLLCQRIAEGASLTAVCKEEGMPTYSVLCQWRRHHPEIDASLSHARRDRAEFLRDEALLEAKQAEGRDPISGAQLRVDTYKWAAGVDDGKYSPKAKVEATINNPTQIVVYTGIDRAVRDVTPALPEES